MSGGNKRGEAERSPIAIVFSVSPPPRLAFIPPSHRAGMPARPPACLSCLTLVVLQAALRAQNHALHAMGQASFFVSIFLPPEMRVLEGKMGRKGKITHNKQKREK